MSAKAILGGGIAVATIVGAIIVAYATHKTPPPPPPNTPAPGHARVQTEEAIRATPDYEFYTPHTLTIPWKFRMTKEAKTCVNVKFGNFPAQPFKDPPPDNWQSSDPVTWESCDPAHSPIRIRVYEKFDVERVRR